MNATIPVEDNQESGAIPTRIHCSVIFLKFKHPVDMRRTIYHIVNTLLTALLLIIISVCSYTDATAQESSVDPQFRSLGVYMGTYSPSFDYFDRTFWDFSGGASFGIESELNITDYFGVRGSTGYYSISSTVSRVIGVSETLRYQMIPLSLSPYVLYKPEYVTLFLKTGVDLLPIFGSYNSNFQSQSFSGSTTTFHIEGAVEVDFDTYGISLFAKYVVGSFDQDFTFSEGATTTEENIDLNGFNFGLSFKYLF